MIKAVTTGLFLVWCFGHKVLAATPIWFKPLAWSINQTADAIIYSEHDFPALLSDDAAWDEAASHVSVFTLPGNVVWSYPDLPGLVASIKRHGFPQVALTGSVLFDGGSCSTSREGISKDKTENAEAIKIAAQWRAAGGRLDYFIMDSPLYSAHYAVPACNMTVNEVAARAAATVSGIRASFPDVQFVDADGPGIVDEARWLDDMKAWFVAFKAASGTSIVSVDGDFHWDDARPGMTLPRVVQDCLETFGPLGVKTGLIINATGGPQVSDTAWLDAVRQHAVSAVTLGLNLDYIALDTWQNKIRYNLPETDPTSWTSLILDIVNSDRR